MRRLLDELHAEQMAVPDELQVERDLRDMRFDLERIALQLGRSTRLSIEANCSPTSTRLRMHSWRCYWKWTVIG